MVFCLGSIISGGIFSPAIAQPPQQGSFHAHQACPALTSIKKATNTGQVSVAPGQSYPLLGSNSPVDSHYLIHMKDVEPAQRWVLTQCGQVDLEGATEITMPKATLPAEGAAQDLPKKAKSSPPFYVLALSWQPAFCETSPRKPECKLSAQRERQPLSLHGLWPQPAAQIYCQVSAPLKEQDKQGNWKALPALHLTPSLAAKLAKLMPGVDSGLDRHEWIKHGTCYSKLAEDYYKDSVRLMDEMNTAGISAWLAERQGQLVSTTEIRARFDQAFGLGAGKRVRVECKRVGDKLLIAELTLGLKGDIAAGTDLGKLLLASLPTTGGCPAGYLDTP